MNRLLALYRSQLGKKTLVAITGLVMVGFLIGHLTGNLKAFLPDPEPGVADIDVYGEFLRTVGEPVVPRMGLLWATRVILLVSVTVHLVCVLQLVKMSRRARSARRGSQRYLRASLAARLMLLSGGLLFAFVVFHILHFTVGSIDPENFEAGEVYANLYNAFTRWPFVALYVVAMAAVALHLYHGVWSVFQTLGLDSPDRNRALRGLAGLLAVGLFAGFVSVPLSFLTGVLGPPAAGHAELGPYTQEGAP